MVTVAVLDAISVSTMVVARASAVSPQSVLTPVAATAPRPTNAASPVSNIIFPSERPPPKSSNVPQSIRFPSSHVSARPSPTGHRKSRTAAAIATTDSSRPPGARPPCARPADEREHAGADPERDGERESRRARPLPRAPGREARAAPPRRARSRRPPPPARGASHRTAARVTREEGQRERDADGHELEEADRTARPAARGRRGRSGSAACPPAWPCRPATRPCPTMSSRARGDSVEPAAASARTRPRAMGSIMAAVAVLLIHIEMPAVTSADRDAEARRATRPLPGRPGWRARCGGRGRAPAAPPRGGTSRGTGRSRDRRRGRTRRARRRCRGGRPAPGPAAT